MFRSRPTIRRKLILSISLPLLVTYLGLLGWDYYRQRSLTVQQMEQTVLDRAEGTAARLDTRLSSVVHATDSLATLLESSSNRNERQVQSALSGAIRIPWVISANITVEPGDGSPLKSITRHRGGGPVFANRDRTTIESVAPDWHARAKSNPTAGWTEPYELGTGDQRSVQRVCTYIAPIVADNRVAGSAAVTVSLRELRRLRPVRGGPDAGPPQPSFGRSDRRATTLPTSQRTFAEAETSPPNDMRGDLGLATSGELEDFAILDPQGRVVVAATAAETSPPPMTLFEAATRLDQPEVAEAARDALKGKSQVIRVTGLKQVIPTVPDDKHHWVAMTPIPATGWLLVSAVPESVNLAPVLQRLWGRAAFLAGGLVVLLIVVLAVSVGISRPIERLAAAVDQVAAGNLGAELHDVKSKDELGRLTVGFNNMTRQLRHQITALTEQSAAREKVESELRIARQIQNDLLPRTFPDAREFALHAINLPALQVAGDFYDFFFTPGGLLNLVIADVSGKGVPAALLMAVTRTVVRNLAQAGHSPVQIAQAANRTLVADSSASMFVTMLLGQYDPSTGRLTYVNAGHPPALRLRPGSDPAEICARRSPLLGVDAGGSMGPFEQGEEQLAPGDTLFLYTDGVSEAPGSNGELLGISGVAEFLRPLAGDAPNTICRRTSDRLEQLSGGHRNDDITMLALRRLDASN